MNVTVVPKTVPDMILCNTLNNTHQTSKRSINTSFFNSPKAMGQRMKSGEFLRREAMMKQKMLNLEKNFSPTNSNLPTASVHATGINLV